MTHHQKEIAILNKQAKFQLSKAKLQEAELLAKGWRYIKSDSRTLKLVPPHKFNNHGNKETNQ